MPEELTVKQLRLVKEKTQKSCAKAIGVHVNTYREMEKHPENFTIQQAVALCDFLGTNYDMVIFLPKTST